MEAKLAGTAALVTGASSGIGAATARRLAEHGASVALVARRRDRLDAPAAEIGKAGGTALAVEADITDRVQAEAAIQQAAGRFGRLDTLVNNAGLMLPGPVPGADPEEWDRMIAINVQGLLYPTRAALPHPLQAAQDGLRRVADIVHISSIAGRGSGQGHHCASPSPSFSLPLSSSVATRSVSSSSEKRSIWPGISARRRARLTRLPRTAW
jgi:NADP-dependent 3-hydroxy acid dehydrogenase YdfG